MIAFDKDIFSIIKSNNNISNENDNYVSDKIIIDI